jgi:TnpA family transposase
MRLRQNLLNHERVDIDHAVLNQMQSKHADLVVFRYRPETGKADAYANLQLILTKPIDWELVRQQYDQMIKYTTALRLGTAETEAILRRFTKKNVQHPTYKALAELGKAIKTIFLCRYLHSKELRREINEGLNVVEQWNGATDFVFFARRGEMVSWPCESTYWRSTSISVQ